MKVVKKLAVCAVVFILSACGSSHEPQDQKEFKELTSALSDEYKKAKSADDKLALARIENVFKKELKETNRHASSWIGYVDHANSHYVSLRNDDQKYSLKIFDAKAVEYAGTLESGDEVVFSGNMGGVESFSVSGGLNRPEFYFYPTSFRKFEDEVGVEQNVNAKLAEEQRLKDELNTVKNKALSYLGSPRHGRTGDSECRKKVRDARAISERKQREFLRAWYGAWFMCSVYADNFNIPDLQDYMDSRNIRFND